MQKTHDDVFEEIQELKKQIVGIEEIKKDRNERIDKLRRELQNLQEAFDGLENQHTVLKVRNEQVETDYTELVS